MRWIEDGKLFNIYILLYSQIYWRFYLKCTFYNLSRQDINLQTILNLTREVTLFQTPKSKTRQPNTQFVSTVSYAVLLLLICQGYRFPFESQKGTFASQKKNHTRGKAGEEPRFGAIFDFKAPSEIREPFCMMLCLEKQYR